MLLKYIFITFSFIQIKLLRQSCSTFCSCGVRLKILFSFNQLKITHGLREAAVYIFLELSTAHLYHLFYITYLQIQQTKKRQSHNDS